MFQVRVRILLYWNDLMIWSCCRYLWRSRTYYLIRKLRSVVGVDKQIYTYKLERYFEVWKIVLWRESTWKQKHFLLWLWLYQLNMCFGQSLFLYRTNVWVGLSHQIVCIRQQAGKFLVGQGNCTVRTYKQLKILKVSGSKKYAFSSNCGKIS